MLVGLGISGMAVLKLMAGKGARVNVCDLADVEKLGPRLMEASSYAEKIEVGRYKPEWFEEAELIVVSPGVPLASPIFQIPRAKGSRIVSEVEVASWFITAPILAVTGTDGKSTTCALTFDMLEASGLNPFLGGNIGRPLSEMPLCGASFDLAVVELSSFQLEAIDTFHPLAAAITNLSFDHRDRYPNFQVYTGVKRNIFRNMRTPDLAVLNAGDESVVRTMRDLPCRVQWFGDPEREGADISDSWLVIRTGEGERKLDIRDFTPSGAHNRENLSAACLLALAGGATLEGISAAIKTFRGLPHRLEAVGEVHGVRLVNDSKATTPEAVRTALRAIEGPVILLMGGRSKGGSFKVLAEAAKERVKLLLTFGEASGLIAGALREYVPMMATQDLAEAVRFALREATAGDTVLLSPGCTSFDAYESFELRGRHFREIVHAVL